MSIYQLRTFAASLVQAEENKVKDQEETEAGVTMNAEPDQNDDEGHDSQELRSHALRALLLSRQRKRSSEDTKKDSVDVEATSKSGAQCVAAVESKPSGKRSRVLDSDDDEDDKDERGEAPRSKMTVETEEGDQSDEETRSAPAKRRRHRVLSDDEEDD